MSATHFKRSGIPFNDLENVLNNSRNIFINQLKMCSKEHLLQGKEIPLKNNNRNELLNNILNCSKQQINIEEKENENWHILTLNETTISDLPIYLQDIYNKIGISNELYYTTLFDDVNGFWYALLAGLDSSFIGRTKQSQLKYILDLKQNMMNELDKYFEPLHYRGFGFTKVNMLSLLQQSDLYNSCLGHYAGDYLNLNIVIINDKNELLWVTPYNENRVTFMMFRDGLKWGSVIHPDNKSHLIKNAKETLEVACSKADVIQWENNSHKETDVIVLKSIKKELKNLKIKELSDKAEKLEISLVDSMSGKKKIKEKLIHDVYYALTGQEL